MLLTNVIIILNEEAYGRYASPHLPIVLLANLPWLVFPLLIIGRLWRSPHPFTRAAAKERFAPTGAMPALSEKG